VRLGLGSKSSIKYLKFPTSHPFQSILAVYPFRHPFLSILAIYPFRHPFLSILTVYPFRHPFLYILAVYPFRHPVHRHPVHRDPVHRHPVQPSFSIRPTTTMLTVTTTESTMIEPFVRASIIVSNCFHRLS
jgi:hypothetical protein